MKKFKSVLIKIVILLSIVYLIASATYITKYIDFGTPPTIVGMGYSPETNILRNFMGLPSTYSTYEGISPIFLIESIIKIIIAIILITYYLKKEKKIKNKTSTDITIFILVIIALIIGINIE